MSALDDFAEEHRNDFCDLKVFFKYWFGHSMNVPRRSDEAQLRTISDGEFLPSDWFDEDWPVDANFTME